MAKLSGKVSLVTGGSGSIGRAIAVSLAKEGSTVIVHYAFNKQAAEEVVREITNTDGNAVAIHADLTKISDIKKLFEDCVEKFGRLDILVNNAGVETKCLLQDVSDKAFEAVFAVNVKGTLFTLREAALIMEKNGRIVNISSSVVSFPDSELSIYAASKAAIEIFAPILAKEIGHRGITINNVRPGATLPGMFKKSPEHIKDIIRESSPEKRLGTPEDTAAVVSFLCSEGAQWITGQSILVNGGAVY